MSSLRLYATIADQFFPRSFEKVDRDGDGGGWVDLGRVEGDIRD